MHVDKFHTPCDQRERFDAASEAGDIRYRPRVRLAFSDDIADPATARADREIHGGTFQPEKIAKLLGVFRDVIAP